MKRFFRIENTKLALTHFLIGCFFVGVDIALYFLFSNTEIFGIHSEWLSLSALLQIPASFAIAYYVYRKGIKKLRELQFSSQEVCHG